MLPSVILLLSLVQDGVTEDKETEAERQRQRVEQVRQQMEANSARLEPLGLDRRYNRYWRLPGGAGGDTQRAQQEQPEGSSAEAAGVAAGPAGDRLLFEGADDGQLSVVATSAALSTLLAALERRGAREGGLYASLLRHKEQLEAGMPSGEGGAASWRCPWCFAGCHAQPLLRARQPGMSDKSLCAR